MNTHPRTPSRAPGGYVSSQDCDLAAFKALVERRAAVPQHAQAVAHNIPIYDIASLAPLLVEDGPRQALMAEWAAILRDGPGVIALRDVYRDTGVIDAATAAFEQIIAEEKAAGAGQGDHFAAAGANDRVWNALQKLGQRAPALFVRYFGNPAIAAICEAWLGPDYQITAQINLVHPGGAAQRAHRDYHLGFMPPERAARFPAHVHDLSPFLTLQGGIAHCDMPIEAGPTQLLPFSQNFRAGYLAFSRPEFRAYFEAHAVQLPLSKGDAVFFNPALFHAAGENRTADVERMVSLLQVSSAMGRAMESVDRRALCKAVYPALLAADLEPLALEAAIAATAEGYAFPTNLDTDPPLGGLAPASQADLIREALAARVPPAEVNAQLDALAARQQA